MTDRRDSTLSLPDPKDEMFLFQCVSLAHEAFAAGDNPFGSVLVDENHQVLATARNSSNTTILIAHPEYELAKWALENLSLDQRRKATMYTSGEHCPMCAGAHAFAQIGRLVFLSSAAQLSEWRNETNAPEALLHFVPCREIIKHIQIDGPFEGALLEEIKALQLTALARDAAQRATGTS